MRKFANGKRYWKVRDHYHFIDKDRGTAHSISNLDFNVPTDISVVFHNGSNYDYDFIIKELEKDFEENLNVSGKIQKKPKLFLFQYKKKLQILISMVTKYIVTIS